MKFVSQMRAVMARSATLAAGLVLAIFVCALMPSPTAAATPGANLGVRVAVSFELSAGKRIAYTLNSDGKKTASRIASLRQIATNDSAKLIVIPQFFINPEWQCTASSAVLARRQYGRC